MNSGVLLMCAKLQANTLTQKVTKKSIFGENFFKKIEKIRSATLRPKQKFLCETQVIFKLHMVILEQKMVILKQKIIQLFLSAITESGATSQSLSVKITKERSVLAPTIRDGSNYVVKRRILVLILNCICLCLYRQTIQKAVVCR